METALDLAGAPVAILGWAGSTERQLRPVVSFYRERGGAPLTARSRVFRNMARPDGWTREGEALAPRLRAALARSPRPLVVHLFSNAGFWTWSATLRALDPASRARVGALILDSAPGFGPHIGPRFYADNATRAMMPMVLRSLGRPPALSHPALTPPVWLFMRGWYHVSHAQQREAERSLEVVRSGTEAPMLFLYSDADALVDASYVEAFARSVEGRRVERARFEGSPHVVHMVRHRQAYFARVARFLDGV